MISVSTTAIDKMIMEISDRLSNMSSEHSAEYMIAPLSWYINTGRAPLSFIRAFINADHRQITSMAYTLNHGGSYDDVISHMCKTLKVERGV